MLHFYMQISYGVNHSFDALYSSQQCQQKLKSKKKHYNDVFVEITSTGRNQKWTCVLIAAK